MAYEDYLPTEGERARLEELTTFELDVVPDCPDPDIEAVVVQAGQTVRELAALALLGDGDAFAAAAGANRAFIVSNAYVAPEMVEVLVIGYKAGIADGSVACMNDLGTYYYMGDLADQDYEAAAELYDMASERGSAQSTINLGYIYEYGRVGEPDYDAAYHLYALAAALAVAPGERAEALYKLGDMYSRGRSVEHDLRRASALWERSLAVADDLVVSAQPSIRLARLLFDDEAVELGVAPDPFSALRLFQQAEMGLRIDIGENGLTYYYRRLAEAIEGQQRARDMLDVSVLD